ncbi:hypothetical protein BD289DRAFT_445831 [Coniella lustricola]|uniref:Uncharacterized protein n=1 Tax=Coniella lustricola TaxID=2025994 RepID=A0A2T2ZUH4_9PEZI|nr:hypothetical protein BD289DRAFT_445831 [Coniella lustricola]
MALSSSVNAVSIELIDPGQQSFLPRPFGGSAQIVLNTTSFDDIILQLSDVAQASETQLAEQAASNTPTTSSSSSSSIGALSILSSGCYINSTAEAAAANSNGWAVGGNYYKDCAAACANPSLMFNSSYTLWNCLTLAAASQYVGSGQLTIDTSELTTAGASMGFTSLADFNATQIFEDTTNCIKASCQDYSLGSCSSNVTDLEIGGSANQAMALYHGAKDYCSGMDSAVNSDIAGPGVVISYILQAALAIAVSVLINIFTEWMRPVLSWLYSLKERMTSGPPRRQILTGRHQQSLHWQRADEHQKRIARSRPAAALLSVLAEFQEVQVFFVASIQLTTLAIFASSNHAAMLSSSSSFAEAVLNVEIVQMLSVTGTLPLLFTQIGLMRLGVRWWYLTVMVLLTFSLAIIISQQSLMPDYDTLWNYFKENAPIEACGDNPSPMTYCLDTLTGIDGALGSVDSGLFVGFFVFPALVADNLWHSLNRHGKLDKRLDNWEVRNSSVLFLRRRAWPILKKAGWFCLEFALLIYVGMYLKALIDILKFVGTAKSSWTFGQLIAVMVWAPLAGKYLYYNLFGVTEGVEKRLSSRYKVVEMSEDEQHSRDGAGLPTMRHESIELARRSESFHTMTGKPTLHTLSREDTLVATLTPGTPRTPYSDSPYERKNNPFDGLWEK